MGTLLMLHKKNHLMVLWGPNTNTSMHTGPRVMFTSVPKKCRSCIVAAVTSVPTTFAVMSVPNQLSL